MISRRHPIIPDPDLDPVLADVERFIEARSMSPTTFGRVVLNDSTFVHELRKGRELKRATRARVLEFIDLEMAKAAGKAA
jgi:hypothetical protein